MLPFSGSLLLLLSSWARKWILGQTAAINGLDWAALADENENERLKMNTAFRNFIRPFSVLWLALPKFALGLTRYLQSLDMCQGVHKFILPVFVSKLINTSDESLALIKLIIYILTNSAWEWESRSTRKRPIRDVASRLMFFALLTSKKLMDSFRAWIH